MMTEHNEGISLDAHCRRGALLPRDEVVEIVAGAAEQLAKAHRKGIVHGDIRPERLIRVGPSVVKVSGLEGREPASAPSEREHPDYLSPEIVRGSAADAPSDLFALAVVLFELLVGEKPFPGDSESSILYRIVHEPPRDPGAFEPPVATELRAVVLRALAKRPDDRYADGDALAAALRAASVADGVERAIGTGREEEQEASPPAVMTPETRLPPASKSSPRRGSAVPYIVAAIVLIAAGAATVRYLRGPSDGGRPAPPADSWLEARVTTEPADLEVQLDGMPLDPANGGVVRFNAREPYGTLTAELGCRTVEHALSAGDAGGELVLVVDPVELDWRVDPAVDGAAILLNGESAGAAPADLRLDLCRENRLELRAAGYHPASVEIAAGATPLDARTRLTELTLVPIPRGRLALPGYKGLQLVYYVDGKRIRSSARELELEEGEHEVRIKNEYHWLDTKKKFRVAAGETVDADFGRLAFADLAVQAFPSNCKVYLRRPGGRWRYLDETPASRRVATGRYEVKVELNPTGATSVREVELREGENPPVRFSFGSGG